MRHFTLINSSKETWDITTTEVLFHDISGLGFEEENDFRQIGDYWQLNRSNNRQGIISGKIMFTENGDTDPYLKYARFFRFVDRAPLTMLYNPFREIVTDDEAEEERDPYTYYRTVRVTKLEKTELNEYGVLDSSIEFTCYAPWYTLVTQEFEYKEPSNIDQKFIFAGTSTEIVVDPDNQETSEIEVVHPPLVFEPGDTVGVTKPIFREEPAIALEKTVARPVKSCPAILTIYGPLRRPVWSHSIVYDDGSSVLVGSGGFSDVVELLDGDKLIIDGTAGEYKIQQVNANGTTADLYSKRNFSLPCFINLRAGRNRILVSSLDGGLAKKVTIEGHRYYATV